jgi:drug/metabolite transporter (DMT)-like permease
LAVIIYLPWVILDLSHFNQTGSSYLYILASMFLHSVYTILLAKTYSLGDLSQVYPIMRGTSPLLVPLIGVIVLNQHLDLKGWGGILMIVTGIILISGIRFGKQSNQSLKPILLASGVGISIASYIIVDALLLRYWSPLVLNELLNLGNAIALSYAVFRSGAIRNEWKINWKTALLGGILAPGGYLLFLYAISLAPVVQLAPMREIGTVFGTFLGIFILNEKQGKSRIIASVIITIGVILLGFSGR